MKKSKQQRKNPFFDEVNYESDIIGFARPRKGRSSKKDKAKTKNQREGEW